MPRVDVSTSNMEEIRKNSHIFGKKQIPNLMLIKSESIKPVKNFANSTVTSGQGRD